MENLNTLIAQALTIPRDTHRVFIYKFRDKIIDVDDFVESLKTQLGYEAEADKIESFEGYNPAKPIDGLIYNFDKRGWLYIEVPTRELFFILASKYPYPKKILERERRRQTFKSLLALGFVLIILVLIVYALIRCSL